LIYFVANKKFIPISNPGGIVLGSGLSHMLPDSASGFRAHFGDDSYPYAEMIAGGTLIVLYAIEKIALGGQHSHSDVNCTHIHD
jgi:hypothetical protein